MLQDWETKQVIASIAPVLTVFTALAILFKVYLMELLLEYSRSNAD